MNTLKFPESNYYNAKNVPAVDELRTGIISDGVKHNWTITCHQLSWSERLRVLFTGIIWAVRMTDATILTVDKTDVIK